MGKDLHKEGDQKNIREKILNKIYCSIGKNKLSEIVNPSSDLNSTLDYVSFPPRTNLKPWLTVRKPINSPVLSPILLQIYCIGLIGPISYSFWVWAIICDPTNIDFLNKHLLHLLVIEF